MLIYKMSLIIPDNVHEYDLYLCRGSVRLTFQLLMFVLVFVLEECECWGLFCVQTKQLASHYLKNIY